MNGNLMMEISSWAGRGLSNKNVHAMTHTKKFEN